MNARQALDAASSAEVEVALFVIEHPSLASPVRLSTDPTERLSADPLIYGTRSSWFGANKVTEPYLFVLVSAELPGDQDDAPAAATLVLESVDNDIAKLLRSFTDRPVIHMAVVLASSPDLVEMECRDLRIVAAEGDAGQVSLTLTRAPIEDETVPMDRFTRDRFPGLFQ
ncbi:hypothetical protein SAMN05444336_112124 [Albimonas donghaensis]|uniref:DUF1833 domain-containing protein n=1 Tax=Albimonas donghaensis TaxID=356660 RepID=A0A1H3FHR0_9RHOB|nr:hypothetical protein [Albimonas donghaensis]SDX90516.1 hypothetical protein SAMN05444336_112124 [Albimonas donghaensis]